MNTKIIEDMVAGFNGRVGIAALNLQTDEQLLYHAGEIFPTASTIKLPVLVTLMQQVEAGLYGLDDPLMLRRADQIGGSGLLQFLIPGLIMPIRDWAFLMMSVSDNLATNVLIDQVGLKNVQEWLQANDYPDVQLHRKIDFGELAKDITNLGTATPAGLNRLLTAVFRQQILSPTTCTEMLRMMNKVGADRVGRYLPFEPHDDPTPEDEKLQLAGKTGSLKGCRAQTAVIWRNNGDERRGFSLTVMADGDPAPETWSVDAAGVLLIGRIARAIYDQVFT
jgi:beta-lactamase class A